METLAFIFEDAMGNDMTEVSHARSLPWGKVYAGGKGQGHVIPYKLALESPAIIPDMPSLDRDELIRRRAAFKEIENATADAERAGI